MRPRNASTAARSTGMMALGISPCASRWTSLGGGGVRRMDKAKGGAIVLVEPIGHVFYAVSILNVDVPAVRLGDIIRLQPAQVVAVHENRHVISTVAAAVRSHFERDRNLSRKRFDLRLAFDVHGCAETIISARYGFRDAQRSRKWGKLPFLAAPPTSELQRSDVVAVRKRRREAVCYTQWPTAGEQPHDEAGQRKRLTTCASLRRSLSRPTGRPHTMTRRPHGQSHRTSAIR